MAMLFIILFLPFKQLTDSNSLHGLVKVVSDRFIFFGDWWVIQLRFFECSFWIYGDDCFDGFLSLLGWQHFLSLLSLRSCRFFAPVSLTLGSGKEGPFLFGLSFIDKCETVSNSFCVETQSACANPDAAYFKNFLWSKITVLDAAPIRIFAFTAQPRHHSSCQ